jgi:uncharacterized protein (DUF1778 family)
MTYTLKADEMLIVYFCQKPQRSIMPRVAIENNSRVAMRIRTQDKAKLMRAGALEQIDLTEFILRNALLAADRVIARAEHITLSDRDSARVLELLENPPPPNARLLAAARALPA